VRPSDLVGRFGGEEFVLLLTDSSPVTALGTAERVRRLVEQLAHPVGRPAPPVRVTVSVGVASLGTAGHDLTGLLEQADAALLRAKADGRDRVRVAPPVPLEPLTADL
jgi:diguanylate cyclase (GGDEF)-like protein